MTDKESKIEVPSSKRTYKVALDMISESGFTGLPFEWERQIKDLGITADEAHKSPFEILMAVNFVATEGFRKMESKTSLYQKMSKICDNIVKYDPFKHFKKLALLGDGGFG